MKRASLLCSALLAAAAIPGTAHAGEVFGGIYVHDVDTPLSIAGIEDGMDVQLGWRGDRIGRTPLQPFVYGSLNTAGETNYAAAGVSARFGGQVYVRPGFAVAVHTGSAANFQHFDHDHVDFGSRILFAPEVALGFQMNERVSVEASWVHLSHGQLFGRQNPGMDNFGARLNFRF